MVCRVRVRVRVRVEDTSAKTQVISEILHCSTHVIWSASSVSIPPTDGARNSYGANLRVKVRVRVGVRVMVRVSVSVRARGLGLEA